MQNLILVKKELIGKELVQAVNARDLHTELESKQDFSDWIKKRIADYGFVVDIDYIRFHKKKEANNATMTEYIVSLDILRWIYEMVARMSVSRVDFEANCARSFLDAPLQLSVFKA